MEGYVKYGGLRLHRKRITAITANAITPVRHAIQLNQSYQSAHSLTTQSSLLFTVATIARSFYERKQ